MTDPTTTSTDYGQWVAEGEALAVSLAPLVPGNAGLALQGALLAIKAVQTAMATKTDITDDELADIFGAYTAAQAADDAGAAAIAGITTAAVGDKAPKA